MKNTKNQSNIAELESSFYEKYDKFAEKLTKQNILEINKLVREKKFSEAISIIEKVEIKNEIPFTYNFNDEGLTIHIPKRFLTDKNDFKDKNYSTVISFGNYGKAIPLYDGTNLAFAISVLNWKELLPRKEKK